MLFKQIYQQQPRPPQQFQPQFAYYEHFEINKKIVYVSSIYSFGSQYSEERQFIAIFNVEHRHKPTAAFINKTCSICHFSVACFFFLHISLVTFLSFFYQSVSCALVASLCRAHLRSQVSRGNRPRFFPIKQPVTTRNFEYQQQFILKVHMSRVETICRRKK